MTNFYILLSLCLIIGLNGILDDDIHFNSKLKSVLIENNSSDFSKKFKSLKGEAIKSRTFNNPSSTGGGDIVKSFRSGFKSLCKTFFSRLESRRCKPACYNGKCYNFCSQVKESCTY